MYDKNEKIYATDINALKARVKAEMLRRNKTGSLSAYGGSDYDFTDIPAQGEPIKQEHYTKIREPISKVNTNNLPAENAEQMPSLTALEGQLTVYESYNGKSSSNHGCMGSCSGLCQNSCTSCTSCSGCSGCGSGCATGCTSCTGGCSGCGSGCATGCTGCSGGCTGCSGCGGCGGNCYYGCTGSCSGQCTSCTGGCAGCTGGGYI